MTKYQPFKKSGLILQILHQVIEYIHFVGFSYQDFMSDPIFGQNLQTMKYLYTFFIAFIAFNLSAQTNLKPAEALVRKYATFWSDPSHSYQVNERSLVFAPAYKLDSILTNEDNGVTLSRTEATYNSLGHTTEMRQFDLDSTTFQLELYSVTNFSYETPGYVSNILSKTYNPASQQLEDDLEMDIEYDGQNRVDSIVISLEDPLFGGGFGPFLGVKQVYNGDLLVQSRNWLYIALAGGWIPTSVTDYTYDEDVLIEQVTTLVDFSTGELTLDTRTTYEYTSEGLQQSVTTYTYEEPLWVESTQEYYEYYNNGTVSTHSSLVFNTQSGEWENAQRVVYPVEEVDFEYPSVTYVWDSVLPGWVKTDSTINLLNPDVLWGDVAAPTQIAVLAFIGGEAADIGFDPEASSIEEIRNFIVDDLSGELTLDYSDVYYYSPFETSAVNPVLPEYLSVTPNPAQHQFFINLNSDLTAEYTVFNNTGAALASGRVMEGQTTVYTNGWTPGLYYVLITSKDGASYIHKQLID